MQIFVKKRQPAADSKWEYISYNQPRILLLQEYWRGQVRYMSNHLRPTVFAVK
ncbi:MAG: hypothetical protein ACMUEK_02315 [Sodalis sp. (in: enterobacteria)]